MPGEVWLGYAGSLSTSYDLPLVFDALRQINDSHVRFIVMGDGPLRDQFKSEAEGLYVTFTGRMPYKQMCGTLAACDIVVNPIVTGSAASIINKHADYAMSGKAVVNSQDSKEYRDLVDEYKMGFNWINGNKDYLAEKLRILLYDSNLCRKMGENARRCGMERFDRARTYRAIVQELDD